MRPNMCFFIISVVALLGAINAQDAPKTRWTFVYKNYDVTTKFGHTSLDSRSCEIRGYKFDLVCTPKDESSNLVLTIHSTGDQNDVVKGECVLLSSEDTTALIINTPLTVKKYKATEIISAILLDDKLELEIQTVIYEVETILSSADEDQTISDKSFWSSLFENLKPGVDNWYYYVTA